MRDEGLCAVACLLTPEEQQMLLFQGDGAAQEEVAEDVELSVSMRALLLEVETSFGALLRLLERQRVAEMLPPGVSSEYAVLAARAGTAAARVAELVHSFEGFDVEASPTACFSSRPQ